MEATRMASAKEQMHSTSGTAFPWSRVESHTHCIGGPWDTKDVHHTGLRVGCPIGVKCPAQADPQAQNTGA